MKNFILFFFLLIYGTLSAQERYIEGIVTTYDSIAVIGADIQIKSTKMIVKTDTLGCFKTKVSSKDKLKIKAKGFTTQNIKIDENTKHIKINLILQPTEEAVKYAIGYGYIKDKEKLNAIRQLSNKNDFSDYNNIYDLIKDRFPEVDVDGNEIFVRQNNSLSTKESALIVIDGIIYEDNDRLEMLPLTEIKSINIIKDSGTAIYGYRGGNGVVVIETKKGNE